MIIEIILIAVVIVCLYLVYLYLTDKRFKKDIHDKIQDKFNHHIKYKKEEREKLETDEEDEDEEHSFFGIPSIASVIGGFITILIGVSLLGPIAKEVSTYNATHISTGYNTTVNASTWGSTVLGLVSAFFALGLLGIGLAIAFGALRGGMI